MAGQQMALDFDPPSQPEIVYFALRPDRRVAGEMMKVGAWCLRHHRLSARLYDAHRLHVSLVPAVSRRGFRKDDVAAAQRAAASVSVEPFTLSFDRLCAFGGRDKCPVVLCCGDGAPALADFRNALRQDLMKEGLWDGTARFAPHVTLFWGRGHIPETILETPFNGRLRTSCSSAPCGGAACSSISRDGLCALRRRQGRRTDRRRVSRSPDVWGQTPASGSTDGKAGFADPPRYNGWRRLGVHRFSQ